MARRRRQQETGSGNGQVSFQPDESPVKEAEPIEEASPQPVEVKHIEFPRMLYRKPLGDLRVGESCESVAVNNGDEWTAAINAGWHDTE